jgi:hypothetical protein
VSVEGESLHIELSTPGEANQNRTMPAPADCDARAEMAALVIAAWLDVMPVGTIRTPGIPPRERAPLETGGSHADPDDPDNPRVPISTRTLLGGALVGSTDTLGTSAGVAVVVAMPHLVDALGWALEGAVGWSRQMTLGQGSVRYTRPTLAAVLSGEAGGPRWLVRPQGGLALGVLSVRGSDFLQNRSATTVMWGGVAGVTVARAWKRAELWLRLDGMVWPQGRVVRSRQVPTDLESEAPLPGWEVRLAAGFSWAVH